MTDPQTTAERKIPPQDDIGPFYKALGALALVAVLVLAALQVKSGRSLGWPDAVIYGIVALVVLALIRPKKFDGAVKTVADALPFTKYQKPPAPPTP
jgi:hypothetical protein